jgi:hypothetical protein
MMQHWIYERSPLDGVRFEEPLQALKNDIAVRFTAWVALLFPFCGGVT